MSIPKDEEGLSEMGVRKETPTNAAAERIEELLKNATPAPWGYMGDEFEFNDAELINALRNSIESLLAERKRLREALEKIIGLDPEKARGIAKQVLGSEK